MAQQQQTYKPKPPKQGTDKDQHRLADWLPKMQNYLSVVGLWDITNQDIAIPDMTANQRNKNGLAHFCLTDNLSPMYCELVYHHPRAHDIWRTLQQVKYSV